MALEIFWGSGSGPAWRVLLALAVKGIPYESRLLSFSNREHKTPEMLAMNPRGKVPVLRDGDFVLYESLAILTYLDRKHPNPPLFGTTPEQAGHVMRVIMESECYGGPAIAEVTRPLLFNDLAQKRDAVIAGLPKLHEELGRLEESLAAHAFLAGDAISAADVFVLPGIKTMQRAFAKPAAAELDHGLEPLAKACPRLAAWVERMEKLPGYDATFPPHWRT